MIKLQKLQVSESMQLCTLKLVRPFIKYVYENVAYFQSIQFGHNFNHEYKIQFQSASALVVTFKVLSS